MKTNRGYKYRIYPTKKQRKLIHRTFGCVRFIYNKMLEKSKELHEAGENFCSRNKFNYALTELKQKFNWLYEVDSRALTSANDNLAAAFSNYFERRAEKPKFKSKKQDHSYTSKMTNNNIRVEGKRIRLPKIGFIKIKLHREPKGKIKKATISRTSDGKYYVSLICKIEANCDYKPDVNNAIGLDYASNGLYVDNEGRKASKHKFYRESQRKLARQQRKLSRKKGSKKNEKKSNNYKKQQIKVNKIHRKIANQRKDFLHKLSTEIANQYDVVCVEDLNMQNMSNKGFGNGKATMDNGYGMFLNFLEYKLNDRNKFLVKIDRWYPSSQICSKCGSRNPEMKNTLKLKYECVDNCGNNMDRNMNAAINIKREGLRILKEDL